MDYNNYVDLLIVDVNEQLYVVEAPTHEAEEGNLVSFKDGRLSMLGTVVDKLWCEKDDDRYRCMGYLKPILPVETIYKATWQREPAKTT